MGRDLSAKVGPVACQFVLFQDLGSASELTGDPAAAAALAAAVLNRKHLTLVPVGEERRQDAAVVVASR